MKDVVITLPDDIEQAIKAVSGNESEFIIEVVKEKLQKNQNSNIEQQLTEGYRINHKENMSLLKDFAPSDLENWDDY